MSEPALELCGVAKLYGRSAALRSTSLRLEAGVILVLLGPNGSGKTTLLKVIAGALSPTLGSGSVFGHNLVRDRPRLRSIVGFLSGETYLYDDLTVIENLRFTVTMAGRKPESESITRVLAEVGLRSHAGERVRTFSSGMKRRLSLARLLLLEPRLWLLDEPYNNFDSGGADLIDSTVRRVATQGGSVVLATHDADRVLGAVRSVSDSGRALGGVADQVGRLERGALTYFGSAEGYRLRVGLGQVRDAQQVG